MRTAPRGRGPALPASRAWGVLLAAAATAASGCTLEERPEPAESDGSQGSRAGDGVEVPARAAEGTARDSVRSVATAFREALDVGDLSNALRLLSPDARVVDRLGGDPPEGASTGEILLRAVRLRADGLVLDEVDSELSLHGDVAVKVVRSEASWDGDGERAGIEGPVYETKVFVRTEAGWRVGHLHRSGVPAGG